jgi:hypothetical protein
MGWIVIPKGFSKPGKLRVTLQAVPGSGFRWDEFDWTGYANSLSSFTLYFRKGAAAPEHPLGTARPRRLIAQADAVLWRSIFNPAKRALIHANLAVPARFHPTATCIQAVALDGFVASAQNAFKSPAKAEAGQSPSLLLRRRLSDSATRTSLPRTIDQAYHEIGRMFHRSDVPLAGIPGPSATPVATQDARAPHWQHEALAHNALGIDNGYVGEILQMRAAAKVVDQLPAPIEQLQEADRLSNMNVRRVSDFLVQNRARLAQCAPAAAAPTAAEHADSVLATLAHAFPLQARLGLISDWEVDVLPSEVLCGLIRVELQFSQDTPGAGALDHRWLWTTIDEGWPLAGIEPEGAPPAVLRFLKSGEVAPRDALLTTCELRGNLTRTVATIQATFDRAQLSVQGADGWKQPTLEMPSLRTGPLVMYVNGLGDWRAQRLASTVEPGTAANPFTMAELTIGVRPDVHIGNGRWRKLMNRRISYGIASQPDTTGLDPQGREEGYNPLPQFAGEDGQTHDDLFSWNGWNPAVPFPGSVEETSLFGERITVVPGTNPRFRYGDKVSVRLRAALRDGSSFYADDADIRVSGTAAWSLLGAGLLRYEPIAAPELLLASATPPHGWTPLPPSATHVVLSSDPTGSFSEAGRDERWILPGRLPDVFELDKHGCFDGGLGPSDSAFEHDDIRRGETPGDPAVFVPDRGSGHREAPYHPDPLAERIIVALVRIDRNGAWIPVVGSDGAPLRIEHALYGPGRAWPDARALHLTFLGAHGGKPLSYTDQGSIGRVTVRVPPGESFELVAYAAGDNEWLARCHAFGGLAGQQESFLIPVLANPLRVRVSHFVSTPYRPQLGTGAPVLHRELGSFDVVVALDVLARPAATGSLDVQVRWEDPLDLPAAGPPRIPTRPLQSSRTAQLSLVVNLDKELHAAVDRALAKSNDWLRTPVPVVKATQCRHAFPDGRHRMVEYAVVARSSALMPEPDGAIPAARAPAPVAADAMWRSTSEPTPVCILASRAPVAPVVRDVLPAFSFTRERSFQVTHSRRNSGVSLILERGWMESGPGELLAVVLPGAAVAISNGIVSGIGSDPVLMSSVASPGLEHLFDSANDQACRADSPKVLGCACVAPPAGMLFYEPRYDATREGWRVDLPLRDSVALGHPFLRLVLARYQPNGDSQAKSPDDSVHDVRLSPCVAVDFIQLPAQRSATVIAHTDYPEHVTVIVSGPALRYGAHLGLAIQATLEQDISTAPGTPLFVTVSETIMLPKVRESQGIATWRADVKSTTGALHGRVRVRIVERAVDGKENTVEGPLYYFDTVEVSRLAPSGGEA